MSTHPYGQYGNHIQTSYGADRLDPETRMKSHWSGEYEGGGAAAAAAAAAKSSNFVEKFSPPSTTRSYAPSTTSHEPPAAHWNRESQYSDIGSLPSYHDSPHDGYETTKMGGKIDSFRKKLDAGNRARVYLFIAMVSSMMLLFLFTALVWLGLGIIKKPLVYGLDNRTDHTTRPE